VSAVFSIIFFILSVATAFYAGLVLPPSTELSDIFSAQTDLGSTIMPYVFATLGFGSAAIAIASNRSKGKGGS
jgi:hypothetical protein